METAPGWPLLAALLAGLALGGSAFVYLVVLPTASLRLPPEAAETLRRAVLPFSYRICGALNLLAALLVLQRSEALWLGLIAGLSVLLDFGLRPHIVALREAWQQGDASAELPMRRSQRRSAGIALLQSLLGLLVFFRLVQGP
ncbi:MAG: DUF4149 domain-containing protein [Alphaproteobacteria bacterium]|nr:DUF4149 domain-containing protein [Alphaproteobacteria bacterium]